MDLLASRVPLEKALQDPSISDEDKRKLRLAEEARVFAEQKLKLKGSKNYRTFVHLNRPYVTYVVSAAPKHKLEHHLWNYPFVGKMPYKGYFDEQDAKAEELDLQKKDLDTYLRGVAAYSTLGWFNDPILSSMLRYSDSDLVDTVIHELTHATLYIKHEADFNERLATFVGGKGTEAFYFEKEGPQSPTVRNIRAEAEDTKLFSAFISAEISDLKKWYETQTNLNETARQERLDSIQKKFEKKIRPRLKTKSYANFTKTPLNNARLLIYKTYMEDLSDFEELFILSRSDFEVFIAHAESLEEQKDPAKGLLELIQQLKH